MSYQLQQKRRQQQHHQLTPLQLAIQQWAAEQLPSVPPLRPHTLRQLTEPPGADKLFRFLTTRVHARQQTEAIRANLLLHAGLSSTSTDARDQNNDELTKKTAEQVGSGISDFQQMLSTTFLSASTSKHSRQHDDYDSTQQEEHHQPEQQQEQDDEIKELQKQLHKAERRLARMRQRLTQKRHKQTQKQKRARWYLEDGYAALFPATSGSTRVAARAALAESLLPARTAARDATTALQALQKEQREYHPQEQEEQSEELSEIVHALAQTALFESDKVNQRLLNIEHEDFETRTFQFQTDVEEIVKDYGVPSIATQLTRAARDTSHHLRHDHEQSAAGVTNDHDRVHEYDGSSGNNGHPSQKNTRNYLSHQKGDDNDNDDDENALARDAMLRAGADYRAVCSVVEKARKQQQQQQHAATNGTHTHDGDAGGGVHQLQYVEALAYLSRVEKGHSNNNSSSTSYHKEEHILVPGGSASTTSRHVRRATGAATATEQWGNDIEVDIDDMEGNIGEYERDYLTRLAQVRAQREAAAEVSRQRVRDLQAVIHKLVHTCSVLLDSVYAEGLTAREVDARVTRDVTTATDIAGRQAHVIERCLRETLTWRGLDHHHHSTTSTTSESSTTMGADRHHRVVNQVDFDLDPNIQGLPHRYHNMQTWEQECAHQLVEITQRADMSIRTRNAVMERFYQVISDKLKTCLRGAECCKERDLVLARREMHNLATLPGMHYGRKVLRGELD